jgi:predicted nucleotidyltransferase
MGRQPQAKQVGAEQMAMYRRTALLREEEREQYAAARRAEALEIARRAADLLKREFGATRVVVYGSAAHGRWFHSDSDIDLMAEGIPAKLYWRAWNAVDALDQRFEVNLVDWEDARPALREAIEREGIIL